MSVAFADRRVELLQLLRNEPRVIVSGGPRFGKTTFAKELGVLTGRRVRHTDGTIPLGWSTGSEVVSHWLAEPGEWIVEGVSAARAVRKMLALGQRLDAIVVHLTHSYEPLSKGQQTMLAGINSVWGELAGYGLRNVVE